MTADQIHRIVSEGLFPGLKTSVSLVETHISWVILSDVFAYKIKKPVRFDFLDFSELEQRHHFCQEELRLNRRLAPQMYLDVLPIGNQGIGDEKLPTIDYALRMHRMDNSREMDKLLGIYKVSTRDMENLAALLAPFHLQNRITNLSYEVKEDLHDFADLFAFSADLEALKIPDADLLHYWETIIPAFLNQHVSRMQQRIQSGFWVEGHGDLHSRNIFLPENEAPVIFDCLEFNPHFRRLDVLNELAFLCMDLEYYGQNGLSEAFINAYQQHWPCLETKEDALLFTYFKAYRANVRLKVTLLGLRQHPNEADAETAIAYWTLLTRYLTPLTD